MRIHPLDSRARRPAPFARLAISALLVTLPGGALAQENPSRRVVRGTVADGSSGTPLAGVSIVAIDRAHSESPSRAISGPTGEFHLRVAPYAIIPLVASRLGFAPETLTVGARDTLVSLRLRRAALDLGAVLVQAERSFSTAASTTIRALDVALRPRESSQELLRLAPGLIIAQHAGGGKAEQIFLRGFDADHGTDVAISLDGTPVNLVSHGHGQGYADLHHVIPETVERADVRKGPYDARDGDFATAGAVAFHSKDRVGERALTVRAGTFATRHATALVPFGGDDTRSGGYVAASAHGTDGPTDAPQGYRRTNAFAKWTMPVADDAIVFASASSFGARWTASGQIPERAVRSGRIGRFGSIDPSEGGATRRSDASVGARSTSAGDDEWQARLFATRYEFSLVSNFTFFSRDTLHGDAIHQSDRRTMLGGEAWRSVGGTLLGRRVDSRAGVGVRSDVTDVGLGDVTVGAPPAPVVRDRVRQASAYLWGSQDLQLTQRLRLQLAVRGDVFRFALHDALRDHSGGAETGLAPVTATLVSPKASLAFDLAEGTTLFANAGTGFHSNDARAVVRAPRGATVLPRATAAELGARYTWSGGSVAAAMWGLDLASELVYSGDEGTTSASGRTRRTGLDLEGRLALTSWLWADADLNLSRGRFLDEPAGSNRIPLAPTVTSVGGLTIRDVGPLSGGARYRFVGARPAIEDASVTARGQLVTEAFASARVRRVTVSLTIDNLLDATWNEAQFATTSRLRGETADVTELHFTPGAPRSIQLGIGTRF